jgi:hypothetical protein
MNPLAKLAAYTAFLGLAVGGGAAVGNVVGPIDDSTEAPARHGEHEANDEEATADEANDDKEQLMPGGVLIADQGYRIEADGTVRPNGSPAPFSFRIVGPDGATVRDFVASHERELHFIVVGADLSSYAHLHPERADDGTWRVDLPELAAGTYRAFADFAVTDGPELTLGLDLAVSGDAVFSPLPDPSATASVDGYEVTLAGSPTAGQKTEVELTATRNGEPVTDLQPYLGAFGHLVAIRSGDLAYLHVHPLGDAPHDDAARGGPSVRFAIEVPSPGDYRLFFDFSHDGTVHTAAFTVRVP